MAFNQKSRNQGKKSNQKQKYLKCPVQINLLEQDDESWIITQCELNHEGHPNDSKNFFSHAKNKKLDDEDLEYFKSLKEAKVNLRNISKILINRTGKDFNPKDVVNLTARLNKDKETSPVEQVLGDIREYGGEVKYTKADGSDNVDVLWVQTKDMRDHLQIIKPHIFKCDTTFETSSEDY